MYPTIGRVSSQRGRTLTRVSMAPDSSRSGPYQEGRGRFLNPAMSGSRTRSVLLLDYAMESGILGKELCMHWMV